VYRSSAGSSVQREGHRPIGTRDRISGEHYAGDGFALLVQNRQGAYGRLVLEFVAVERDGLMDRLVGRERREVDVFFLLRLVRGFVASLGVIGRFGRFLILGESRGYC